MAKIISTSSTYNNGNIDTIHQLSTPHRHIAFSVYDAKSASYQVDHLYFTKLTVQRSWWATKLGLLKAKLFGQEDQWIVSDILTHDGIEWHR